MPYPAVTFTDMLSNATRQELQQLVALIQGYLSHEHDENGAHTDVTADSLTVEGTLTVEGDGPHVLGGETTVDGNVVLGPAGNSGNGQVGIRYRTDAADSNSSREFHSVSDISSILGGRLLDYDATGDRDMGGWRWNNARTAYEWMPDPTTKADRTVSLGSPTDSSRDGWWDDAYIEAIYIGGNTTTPAGQWAAFSPSWTNLSVGNGTVVARFTKIDNTVHFSIHLTFGGTTSVTGAITVSTPVTLQLSASGVKAAAVVYRDDSAAARYTGTALVATGTTISLFDGAEPMAAADATVPFTFATGDTIHILGTVEEA